MWGNFPREERHPPSPSERGLPLRRAAIARKSFYPQKLQELSTKRHIPSGTAYWRMKVSADWLCSEAPGSSAQTAIFVSTNWAALQAMASSDLLPEKGSTQRQAGTLCHSHSFYVYQICSYAPTSISTYTACVGLACQDQTRLDGTMAHVPAYGVLLTRCVYYCCNLWHAPYST
jgi:hypothetical protein